MARNTFHLPAGVQIEWGAEGLLVRAPGDLVIENDLGRGLAEASAGGDLTIRLPEIKAVLRCKGSLTLSGTVDLPRIEADEVTIEGPEVRTKAIVAKRRITIRSARITSDVVCAPEVILSPDTTGRITMIDCDNAHGARGIKGAFSPSDYAEMIGDPDEYLASRGVGRRQGRASPPTPAPVADVPPDPGATVPGAAPRVVAPPTPAPAPIRSDLEDDGSDPVSLSVDAIEPVAESANLDTRLDDAMRKIVKAYEGELPAPVEPLRSLVDARNYAGIRDTIGTVWDQLLAWHQKKGVRPHHQVTHAFNLIHGAVQDRGA